jgi:hypothetical protein
MMTRKCVALQLCFMTGGNVFVRRILTMVSVMGVLCSSGWLAFTQHFLRGRHGGFAFFHILYEYNQPSIRKA